MDQDFPFIKVINCLFYLPLWVSKYYRHGFIIGKAKVLARSIRIKFCPPICWLCTGNHIHGEPYHAIPLSVAAGGNCSSLSPDGDLWGAKLSRWPLRSRQEQWGYMNTYDSLPSPQQVGCLASLETNEVQTCISSPSFTSKITVSQHRAQSRKHTCL